MKAVSDIVATLLFGLIFFVVIMPLGFVLRLFGYDPLQLAKRSGSAFIDQNKEFAKADFEIES